MIWRVIGARTRARRLLRKAWTVGPCADTANAERAPVSLSAIVIRRGPGRVCFQISSCSSGASLEKIVNSTRGAEVGAGAAVEEEGAEGAAVLAGRGFEVIVLVIVVQLQNAVRVLLAGRRVLLGSL